MISTIYDLRVAAIQTKLHWEKPEENRAHFEKCFTKIQSETDLIVLPEMFTTGFSMNAETLAETMDGFTISWMQEQAEKMNSVISGSLIIKEKAQFFNRLIWMPPHGNLSYYDKRHLFAMAHENKTFTMGKERLVVALKGWRICPLICYDLRFPVWSRNTEKIDVLIYMANWPEKRIDAWKALLMARAIENQCYTIGVNRIGVDGMGYPYTGDSRYYDPGGYEVKFYPPSEQIIHTVILSAEKLKTTREKLPFQADRDKFEIHN